MEYFEPLQFDETTASAIKKRPDQSGIDGYIDRRYRRIEIRVNRDEYERIGQHALQSGDTSLVKYLRETGLNGTTVSSMSEAYEWLTAINSIGNHIASIGVRLEDGHQPDDEILLALMQIQEYAEEIWRGSRVANPHSTNHQQYLLRLI
jgi:hypothetical protein